LQEIKSNACSDVTIMKRAKLNYSQWIFLCSASFDFYEYD